MSDTKEITSNESGRATPRPQSKSLSIRKHRAIIFAAAFASAISTHMLVSSPVTAQESETPSSADKNKIASAATMLVPRAVRSATEKIAPSLVTIESFGGITTVSGRIGGIRKQGEGNTTGLLLQDGFVITSTFNFIQQPPIITVVTSDGIRQQASIVGRDDTRKLCLLKLDTTPNIPPFESVERKDLKVGQWTISVGVGYGDENPAVSLGIVSATHRIFGRAVQTDSNTSPANYGGPLVDIEGRVIGICVPLSPRSSKLGSGVEWYDSGIGFAIPIDSGNNWLERMKKGEHIYAAKVDFKLGPGTEGSSVIVKDLPKDSVAEKAGLKKDDQLISVQGETVIDLLHLQFLIGQQEGGDKIDLVVQRGDKQETIKLELGKITSAKKPFEFKLPR